jgi:hypothetical protein
MKILKISTLANRLFSLVLLLTLSSVSFAGHDGNWPGDCSQANNIVTCTGSMAGVRKQTADPGRYVYFFKSTFENGYTYMSFQQKFNNKIFRCNPPGTQEWLDIWDNVMMSNAYYLVKYDVDTGVCKEVNVINGSAFKNASAL